MIPAPSGQRKLYLDRTDAYRDWLVGREQETKHFYLCHIKTLELLDELLSLWENRPENWQVLAQERIGRVKEDWIEYLL